MSSRRVQVFVAVLVVGALVRHHAAPLLPFLANPGLAFLAIGALAAAAAWAVGRPRGEPGGAGGRPGLPGLSGGFLCDSCRYDNPRDCDRPERPNATRCPDYKAR